MTFPPSAEVLVSKTMTHPTERLNTWS